MMTKQNNNVFTKRVMGLIAVLVFGLIFNMTACSLVRAAVPRTGCYKRKGLDSKIGKVIENFRASVPKTVKKGKVSGVAIALVDEKGILWTEGFGTTGGRKKSRVTPDTPFLIGGISKTLTATAVMLAVQDGLVDLDKSITTYLPDFKVYSRYEEHPETKITLRHLLSNTSGLANEMSLGNHFEPSSMASFEDHVKSLYGTWLKFPVGSSYDQSSASFDLAGYILQIASGKPFEQYLKERLFLPLGMSNSTVDRLQILRTKNRALGNMMAVSSMPAVFPALGAGGVYSTARDLARFVQLQISKGILDGKRVLDESLSELMQSPKAIIRDPNVSYGFGMYVDTRYPERVNLILYEDGSGLGFLSFMHWYPEYGIGAVVLTNKLPNSVCGELSLKITDSLVKGKILEKRYPQSRPDYSQFVGPFSGWPGHHTPTPYKTKWKKYCSKHSIRFSAYKLKWWARLAILIQGQDEWTPRIKVHRNNGFLCLTESKFFNKVSNFRYVDEKLQEVKSGIFATSGGDTLDFTSKVPTFKNYRLKKK